MPKTMQLDLDGNRLTFVPLTKGEDGRTLGYVIRTPMEELGWAKPKTG